MVKTSLDSQIIQKQLELELIKSQLSGVSFRDNIILRDRIKAEADKILNELTALLSQKQLNNETIDIPTISPPPTDSGFISSSNPQSPGLDLKIIIGALALAFIL